MTTHDFITELFCPIDDLMEPLPKHPQANLWPSEVVTLGLLYALKGVGSRAFYRWLLRDCRELFPHLPERTRLFRQLKTHWRWTYLFMAQPTLLGVIDTYGIELLHPIREGRSRAQFARKDGPLAKPDQVLLKNTIQGFQSPGSPMAMPPRGGNPNLTDEDIKRVLDFIRKEFGA